MSEDEWNDDEWVDDEYYDEETETAHSYLGAEGFPGYVPTTNDPGPWVFVVVAAVTLLLILALPPLVVWGRQYEARRKAEKAGLEGLLADAYEEEDGEVEGGDHVPKTPGTQCETPTGRDRMDDSSSYGIGASPQESGKKRAGAGGEEFLVEDGVVASYSGDGAVEGMEVDLERSGVLRPASGVPTTPTRAPAKPLRIARQRSDNSRSSRSALEIDTGYPKAGKVIGPKSALSGAGTNVSNMSRATHTGATGARKVFEGAFDKIFIPKYLDEDEEVRTYLSGAVGRRGERAGYARSEAAASAATTSMMRRDKRENRREGSFADEFVSGATDFNAGRRGGRRGRSGDDTSEMSSLVSGMGLHGRRPRILDAVGRPGAGGGRRGGRGRAARKGIGRANMMARAIADEERSELSRSSAGWVQRERIMAEAGGGQMQAAENQSGLGGTPSEMRRRREGGGAAKNTSGPASSVLTSDEQDSGMRAWAQVGRRRLGAKGPRSAISAAASETPSVWKTQPYLDDISPNDAADADDPGQAKPYRDDDEADVTVCCGPMALWRPKTIQYGIDYLVELCEPDDEMKRIVRLGIPYTASEVCEAFFEAVTVAVIAQFVGTNELTAYVVVHLLIGMTDELVNGVIAAESTVCSHALGAGRNYLAGQYVQISTVIYVIFSIPFLFMWVFVVDDVILFLGLSEEIAQIGLQYTRVTVFHYLLDGVAGAYFVLLDLNGHEMFGLWMGILEGIMDVASVAIICVINPNTDMVTIAFLHLIIGVFFFVLTLGMVLWKGWLSAFWGGMLGSFAFKNFAAVKNTVATAIPLSLGSFLEYGEWELLTFLVADLGPAEVATWGILGTLWELFEAATEGISEAAAVRTAYHLGKGNHIMARVSSYKSMIVSSLTAVFITSIMFMCGQNLPTWFTSDPTLQHMLNDLIPLVGFGNITMTVGMTCWSLVGAQGRYRLATLIVMSSSWLVTLPLAALCTIGINLNLKGLIGCVILGYSTAGTVLSYVILRSDWARLSRVIQELNAMTGEVDSSDSESDDESESSSSSSSSSSSESSSDSSEKSSDSKSESESSATGSRLSRRHRIS